jgi:hypothetical protein
LAQAEQIGIAPSSFAGGDAIKRTQLKLIEIAAIRPGRRAIALDEGRLTTGQDL